MKPVPGDRQPVAVTPYRGTKGRVGIVVACSDGTIWGLADDGSWEQQGGPIPGSAADREARNAAEAEAQEPAPPTVTHPPAGGDPAPDPEPIETVVTEGQLVEVLHEDGRRWFELDGRPIVLHRLWDDDGREVDLNDPAARVEALRGPPMFDPVMGVPLRHQRVMFRIHYSPKEAP